MCFAVSLLLLENAFDNNITYLKKFNKLPCLIHKKYMKQTEIVLSYSIDVKFENQMG